MQDNAFEALRIMASYPRGKAEAVLLMTHTLGTRREDSPFARAVELFPAHKY